MPTFINIKAGFPKTISWESNSVHTSLRCRWLTQFYSSIKNELIMQTPKSWDVARSRGKTIYLHRRNYDGAPWIKYVAGCQSNEDVVCDGRQGCPAWPGAEARPATAAALHSRYMCDILINISNLMLDNARIQYQIQRSMDDCLCLLNFKLSTERFLLSRVYVDDPIDR